MSTGIVYKEILQAIPLISDAPGWAVVPMPNVQKKKMQFLLERGGHVESIVLKLKMPNGQICSLDNFGKAKWNLP